MAWNWNNDSGMVAFDGYTSSLIEAAWSAGQMSVTLTHGFFAKDTYSIDFARMKQKNHRTNFERDVSRIPTGNTPRGWTPMTGVSMASYTPPPTYYPPVAPMMRAKSAIVKRRNSGSGSESDSDGTLDDVNATVPMSPAIPPASTFASTGGSTTDDDDDSEVYRWQYSDLNNGWADFDDTAQQIIETAFRAGQTTVNLNHGFFARDGYQLTIIGNSLTQRNLKTNNSRAIRRDPPTRSSTTKRVTSSTASSSSTTSSAPNSTPLSRWKLAPSTSTHIAPTPIVNANPLAIQVNPNLARAARGEEKEEKGRQKTRERSPSPESSDEETRKKRRGIVPAPALGQDKSQTKSLAQQFTDALSETFNNSKYFPDVKFIFRDGKELLAHKVILSARKIAGAFDLEKHFEPKMPLVFIDQFGFTEFEHFLRALYCGRTFVASKDNCEALGRVAKYYQHSQISESCEKAAKGGIFPCYISYHASLTLPEKACLQDYADCDLIVSGVRIPAHRVILCAACEYFRGMFMRGMKEAEEREAIVSEPWDAPTFASFLKSLYCFDFQTSLEPVKLFPRASIDVQQFMEMADMYNVQNMHEECVKSLSTNIDELGLDLNSVVFLFNLMSRPSVRVKFDMSQWGTEPAMFQPLSGPVRACIVIAKDVQPKKYWIGDQDVGVFLVSDSVFTKPVACNTTLNITQYFIPYNDTEKRILNYVLDHADAASTMISDDLSDWPDYLIDGLLLYTAAEKSRATKKPWDMMHIAYHFKRKWAFAAFQLICQEMISVPTVTSIITASHKCEATGLRAKCLEYINAHISDIAEMYQNHPNLTSPSLKSVSQLSDSMANSIHNQIRVGTAKKYDKKCDLCLKSLKGLKVKKVVCPVCKGSMCEDCMSTEVIVLPPVFNISEPVAPCNLCAKIVRATYDVDEYVKWDPKGKMWMISDSDFDVKRHLSKEMQTRYFKGIFEVANSKCDLSIQRVAGQSLAAKDVSKTSDPYYTVTSSQSKREMFKAQKQLKELNPVWNNEENLLNLSWDEDLIFAFWDWDRVGKHSFLGSVKISPMALHILAEEKHSDTVAVKFLRLNQVNPLKDKSKRDPNLQGSVEFQFTIFASNTKASGGPTDTSGKKVALSADTKQ